MFGEKVRALREHIHGVVEHLGVMQEAVDDALDFVVEVSKRCTD